MVYVHLIYKRKRDCHLSLKKRNVRNVNRQIVSFGRHHMTKLCSRDQNRTKIQKVEKYPINRAFMDVLERLDDR